jgi:hypothetical protein
VLQVGSIEEGNTLLLEEQEVAGEKKTPADGT